MRFDDLLLVNQLRDVHPRLRAVLYELDNFCHHSFARDIMLTCLDRDTQDNQRIGSDQSSYHLLRPCCAADMRTTTEEWFNSAQQETIKQFFERWLAIREHDRIVIESDHIHIQIQPGA